MTRGPPDPPLPLPQGAGRARHCTPVPGSSQGPGLGSSRAPAMGRRGHGGHRQCGGAVCPADIRWTERPLCPPHPPRHKQQRASGHATHPRSPVVHAPRHLWSPLLHCLRKRFVWGTAGAGLGGTPRGWGRTCGWRDDSPLSPDAEVSHAQVALHRVLTLWRGRGKLHFESPPPPPGPECWWPNGPAAKAWGGICHRPKGPEKKFPSQFRRGCGGVWGHPPPLNWC